MDPGTKSLMEARFGHDFSRVKIHNHTKAAQSAREIGALAFTAGSQIAFGDGQYSPGTYAGRKLLAHELTHVVQQSRGLAANAGESSLIEAEREAESVSEALGGRTDLLAPVIVRNSPPRGILQRARNCSSPEASLPFTFNFTISEEIYSRSFSLPSSATSLSLNISANYSGGGPPGSAGDYCIQLYKCRSFPLWDKKYDSECFTINGRSRTTSWSGLDGGETYYFRIWKGSQDGLTIDGTGTAT